MADMVVVGSINADVTVRVDRFPAPGETLLGTGASASAGGKGANQAVAAALQGASVAIVGAVGTDAYAQVALENLRSSGVDLTHVREVEGPTGLALITVDAAGENTIVVVPGANGAVLEVPSKVAEAPMVVVQGELPMATVSEAVRMATGRVVINVAPAIELPVDVLRKANPLVVNEGEAAFVRESLGLESLAELGVPYVVTLGARGCVVFDGSSEVSVPALDVRAVDTVGAGDAFVGALCACLLEGRDLVSAAEYASRVAAYSVQREGAQGSYPVGRV